MSAVLDTLIWIVNVPATTGYAWVFIGAFGATGFAMLVTGAGGRFRIARAARRRALAAEAVGEVPDDPAPGALAVIGRGISQAFFGALGLVVIGFGAIGLLSLIFGPVTAGYIYDHGVAVEAEEVDSDYVRFTAQDGVTYTLSYSFFTPPSYPDSENIAFADTAVVRYLPSHPQAFVLDTRASTDSSGGPLGGL